MNIYFFTFVNFCNNEVKSNINTNLILILTYLINNKYIQNNEIQNNRFIFRTKIFINLYIWYNQFFLLLRLNFNLLITILI